MNLKTRDIFDFLWIPISAVTAFLHIAIWITLLIILSALPTAFCRLSGIGKKTLVRKMLLGLWSSFIQPYLMIGLTVIGLIIQLPTSTILYFIFPLYVFSLPLMLYVMMKWLYKSTLESWQENKPSQRPFIKRTW